MMKKKIGFIGIGLMGEPMVRNLLKAKYQVKVFNRTKSKAKKLQKFGAILSNSICEVVKDQHTIISMLSDDKAIYEIYNNPQFIKNIKKGSTVIDMSSTSPKTAEIFSKKLKKNKINFLDAPVSGGTNGAKQATLAIMVGGERKIFKKNLDILSKLGTPVLVGKNSSGQVAKLANQIIVGITIGAVSEAIILCEKTKTNPLNVIASLKGGWADSKILQTHGIRMIKNDFKPRGKNLSQLKDMKNILDCAKIHKIKLPLSNLIKKNYDKLVKNGFGNYDHSSIYKNYKKKLNTQGV